MRLEITADDVAAMAPHYVHERRDGFGEEATTVERIVVEGEQLPTEDEYFVLYDMVCRSTERHERDAEADPADQEGIWDARQYATLNRLYDKLNAYSESMYQAGVWG